MFAGGTADLLPIPMPYLDDENHPNSIALPFRFRSLFSLGNGNTSNVLLRYYELGLGCLARSYRPKDVASFNANVSSWIFKSVSSFHHFRSRLDAFRATLFYSLDQFSRRFYSARWWYQGRRQGRGPGDLPPLSSLASLIVPFFTFGGQT